MTGEQFADLKERVRDASPTNEIIGADAKLTKQGAGWVCNSPLREESNPSFRIYPDGGWYDFGLQQGGDVFEYVMARDRCDFMEALRTLAERVGIEVDLKSDEVLGPDVAPSKNDPYTILTKAAYYYTGRMSFEIREFLRSNYALTDETIDELRIGWAERGLLSFLRTELQATDEELERTGLFLRTDSGLRELFDRRIVFPYWRGGKCRFMTARRFEGRTPDTDWEKSKYKKLLVNSEKAPWVVVRYDVLYGEDSLRRGSGRAVVVEGVTDCAALIQAGVASIATDGTKLQAGVTSRALALTKKFPVVYVCPDNDGRSSGNGKPGANPALEGAVATMEVLFASGVDVRLLSLPGAEDGSKVDPNLFLKNNSAEAFLSLLPTAKGLVDWLVDKVPEDAEPAEVTRALKSIVALLASQDEARVELYSKKISKRLGISRRTIIKEVRAARDAKNGKNGNGNGSGNNGSDSGNDGSSNGKSSPPGSRILVDKDKKAYFLSLPTGPAQISNFVLRPTERTLTDAGELLTTSVDTSAGSVINDFMIPATAWRSRRDFVGALLKTSLDLSWVGNDDNVQTLMAMVSSEQVPRYRACNALGYYSDPRGKRWVSSDMVIGPDGVIDNPDVRYVRSGNAMEDRLRYTFDTPEITSDAAKFVLPKLLEFNVPQVTMPLVGWCFACFLAPPIRDILGHFPLLWIWGSAGSGKTSTMRDVFWRLFGVVNRRDPFSVTDTEFSQVRALSSTTSIPIIWDEFKPKDMPRQKKDRVYRYARRVYDGDVEQRGRADQTLVQYYMHAPLVIMGEMPPADAALLERSLLVVFDKNAITQERKKTYLATVRSRIELLSAPIVRWALNVDVPRRLASARAISDRVLSEAQIINIAPRVRDMFDVMFFGLLLYDLFCAEYGVVAPTLDAAAVCKALTINLSGTTSGIVRDAVDMFIESISTYARMGEIREGTHYRYVTRREDGKTILCLHLTTCYETYLKQRKISGQEDDTNGHHALRRQCAEKLERGDYVVDCNYMVKMEGGYCRAIAIDPEAIPGSLDYSTFPQREASLTNFSRPPASAEQGSFDYDDN